jgi:HlyD family secretion protein
MNSMLKHFNKALNYVLALPRKYTISAAVAILIIAVLGIHFATRSDTAVAALPTVAHVRLSSVASLSSATGPLPVTGRVSSVSEASITAQTSGEITSLSAKIGQRVSAGSVIARFESSSQQAAVLQATGSYDAAVAALSKVSGSTASNSTISSQQAIQNVTNTQASAALALQSAYAAMDDAVRTKGDALFSNPRSYSPVLNLSVSDNQLVTDLQNERPTIEAALTDAQVLANGTPADVDAAVAKMLTHTQEVNAFMTTLVAALNKAISNQNTSQAFISSSLASVSAGRSAVVGAATSLVAAKNAYDSAVSAAASAGNTATGGVSSDIASAKAQIKVAQGALDAARATLEKTVVRSPISGTIVSLPVTKGDFVSMSSPVATISNPQALTIKVYVTPDDAKTIAVGSKVTIGDSTQGVVAPALDPTTNKIEVDIGIVGDQSALTDGETVTVSIDRGTPGAGGTKKPTTPTAITIPIIATKITPQGAVVFSVENNNQVNTLMAHPVSLGAIVGDRVVVTSGLTADQIIVTDARGLADKETVSVDTN